MHYMSRQIFFRGNSDCLYTRFIDSEADLDVAIKSLLPLAQLPTVAYPELLRSGTADALVDLLSHENADLVIDVVEVIHELTDEDARNEEEAEDEESREEVLKELIEGLVRSKTTKSANSTSHLRLVSKICPGTIGTKPCAVE